MPVIERVRVVPTKTKIVTNTIRTNGLDKFQYAENRQQKQRVLRVSEIAYPRRKRDAVHLGDPMQPSIHLKGNWLMEAGFKTGQEVRIEISSKRLIIFVPE